MKIEVWCNNGANIHSERSEEIDTEKDWGISDEEWNEMSENERYKCVEEWAYQRLEIGYRSVE